MSSGLPVTHIVYEYEITSEGNVTTETVTRDLTEEEKSAGTALLTDLQAGTHYVIYIYNGEELRGMTEITTEQIISAISEENIIGRKCYSELELKRSVMSHLRVS